VKEIEGRVRDTLVAPLTGFEFTNVGGVVSTVPALTIKLTERVVFPVPLVVFVKVTVSL
jgi:hypothetical protein